MLPLLDAAPDNSEDSAVESLAEILTGVSQLGRPLS